MIGSRFAAVLAALLVVFVVAAPTVAGASEVDHGKTVLFNNLYIGPDEVVDGNVNVIFGDAQIAGRVRGDVNTLFGKCEKLDGAVIDGQEHCVDDTAAQAFAPWAATSSAFGTIASQDRKLFVKLGSSAIVLLVFLLFPVRTRLALDRVEQHPGLAAVVGTIAMVGIIPLAILLCITIIGIPLIALEAAAILAGVWLGTGAIALLVGRRFCELVMPLRTPSPMVALFLGLVIVSAAEIVPVVGWAVTALVWLVGLGAAILAFMRSTTVDAVRRATIGGPPMTTRW